MDEPGWFLRVDDPAKAFLRLLEGPCRPSGDPEDWLSTEEIVEAWGPQARTAMIHRGAKIGPGTRIGSGVVVHARVRIGADCRIGEGSVLGAPGFGFSGVDSVPIPHWAGVELESNVWIGPLCQVSAGVLDPTWIGTGVRIDSLVQVAHNCRIGAHSLLAGQVGLAGSVELGERCRVGGQAGFADHVTVGADCQIAARAGVTKSWPAGVVLRGFPARTEKSSSCTP
jgi:UDP-3-O-[3-hydroxymyristoyl] glucosamine N-acyltransferase